MVHTFRVVLVLASIVFAYGNLVVVVVLAGRIEDVVVGIAPVITNDDIRHVTTVFVVVFERGRTIRWDTIQIRDGFVTASTFVFDVILGIQFFQTIFRHASCLVLIITSIVTTYFILHNRFDSGGRRVVTTFRLFALEVASWALSSKG